MGTEYYSDSQCSRIPDLSGSETIPERTGRSDHAACFRSDLYVKHLDDDRQQIRTKPDDLGLCVLSVCRDVWK